MKTDVDPRSPGAAVQTDRQLLGRFTRQRDGASFAALVRRNGPMVLGVCRRVLGNAHDAEDAFQATFLVLARKADLIDRRESVGAWLYTVACRTALRARARAGRRARRERPLDEAPIDEGGRDPADRLVGQEFRRVLDAELSRVPEKYRAAFILCCLEGKTCDEAAERLGCPRGTVHSRVGRARERLRTRLSQLGWTPSSGPLL